MLPPLALVLRHGMGDAERETSRLLREECEDVLLPRVAAAERAATAAAGSGELVIRAGERVAEPLRRRDA